MATRIEMERYGGPEVLQARERDDVPPGAGEVAVRVEVAGVNRADCFIRAGTWTQAGSWPYVPGLEAAGVVEALGPGVVDLAVGDPVITMMQRLGGIHGERPGGYQQRLVCPAATLARIPAGLDVWTAGVLGLPAVTALLAIEVLAPAPGHRVLVQGATSQVGRVAIQLLAARGCHVIATGTRAGRLAGLEALGAAELVATREGDWRAGLDPVHGAIDLVGQETFADTVDLLAPGGRLVFVGGTSGGELAFSGWALMRPVALTGYSTETLDRAQLTAAMIELADLWQRGALRVPELHRHPLADAAAAHRALESGESSGRHVLVP